MYLPCIETHIRICHSIYLASLCMCICTCTCTCKCICLNIDTFSTLISSQKLWLCISQRNFHTRCAGHRTPPSEQHMAMPCRGGWLSRARSWWRVPRTKCRRRRGRGGNCLGFGGEKSLQDSPAKDLITMIYSIYIYIYTYLYIYIHICINTVYHDISQITI